MNVRPAHIRKFVSRFLNRMSETITTTPAPAAVANANQKLWSGEKISLCSSENTFSALVIFLRHGGNYATTPLGVKFAIEWFNEVISHSEGKRLIIHQRAVCHLEKLHSSLEEYFANNQITGTKVFMLSALSSMNWDSVARLSAPHFGPVVIEETVRNALGQVDDEVFSYITGYWGLIDEWLQSVRDMDDATEAKITGTDLLYPELA